MTKLKNITDLPLAESIEGLNLIVNDNGAAKQIAASAVGALDDLSQIEVLMDTDMLPAVHDSEGAILTDENNNVILRF